MQAKDLMTAPVLSIGPDATVGEAAKLMLEKKISCLPVVDAGGELVGMLTHSDFELHRKLMAMTSDLYELMGSWTTPNSMEYAAKGAAEKLVKEVMHGPVATIAEDAAVAEIAELMLRMKVHRLPVMGDRQRWNRTTDTGIFRLIGLPWRIVRSREYCSLAEIV